MRLHPLTPLLAPPSWAYSAGFAFGSLAAVLGSEHADVVTSATRAVGFMLAFPVVGFMMSKAQGDNPQDLTRRDWQKIREGLVKEEKEISSKQYALTIAPDVPWYREKNGQVDISKHPRGGYPYLSLPRGVARWQIEAFYDCVIRDGRDATEEILAGGEKPFSQVSLRRWMGWLEQHQWAVPVRKGNHAKRILTPRGKRVVNFVYWRLQSQPDKAGQWVHDNHCKRRYSPPPAGDMRRKQGLQSSNETSSEQVIYE